MKRLYHSLMCKYYFYLSKKYWDKTCDCYGIYRSRLGFRKRDLITRKKYEAKWEVFKDKHYKYEELSKQHYKMWEDGGVLK